MKFHEFVGAVQHRLELPEQGRAVRAIRATLTTLGERLHPGEAEDLASSLPMEIDRYLTEADSGQRLSYDEFLRRLSEREQADPPDALYHAKQIIALVAETVAEEEMRQVRDQLPEEFQGLFELVGASRSD